MANSPRILIQGQNNNSVIVTNTQNVSITYSSVPKNWHRVFVEGVEVFKTNIYEDAVHLVDFLSRKILLMEKDEILLIEMLSAIKLKREGKIK